MKKFKCTVTRTDEYIIEFDESVINEEFMEHFRRYFYNFDTLEDHAEHIAQFRARYGERFIEGYGNPMVNGELPFMAQLTSEEAKNVNHAININVVSEDEDCDVEVSKLWVSS